VSHFGYVGCVLLTAGAGRGVAADSLARMGAIRGFLQYLRN
jgi:hypothetical protein